MTMIWSQYHMKEIEDERVPRLGNLLRDAGAKAKPPAPRPVRQSDDPALRQIVQERGVTDRNRKVMNKALRALREGPQPKTTGTHQDLRGTMLGTGVGVVPVSFPKPEPTASKPGVCSCGCDLIRDAAFDLRGNATGKLTWLCIRCENWEVEVGEDDGRVCD